MIRKNEGRLDRAIRLVVGVAIFAAGLLLVGALDSNTIGLLMAAFGLWLVVTGAIGVCPLYIPFGFSTLRDDGRSAPRSAPFEAPVVAQRRDDARK